MTRVSPLVLIVEDEALIALDLEETVLRLGCLVAGPVSTLEQGCRAAEHDPLDFALLDFNLRSGTNSLPIAEKLGARGIAYAFVTSADPKAILEQLPHARVYKKPIDARDLGLLIGAL